MKTIFVNGKFLSQNRTGVQVFSENIVFQLTQMGYDLTILCSKSDKIREVFPTELIQRVGNLKGHLWEQFDLPSFLKTQNGFLLNLGNTAPIFYKNQISTIHDLAFLKNNKWTSFGFRTAYKMLIPWLIRSSKHILTVSEFSKNEITNYYKCDPKKISILYNGLDYTLEKYDVNSLKEKIILFVGTFSKRKNVETLIKAYQQWNNTDYKLVLLGSFDANLISSELINNDGIEIISPASEIEKINYYKKAEILVCPSIYEGFGIPILEGLHFKCKVIASDIEVFNEVFEDEITYFSTFDSNSLQEKLIELTANCSKSNTSNVSLFNKLSYHNSAEKLKSIISFNFENSNNT